MDIAIQLASVEIDKQTLMHTIRNLFIQLKERKFNEEESLKMVELNNLLAIYKSINIYTITQDELDKYHSKVVRLTS